MRVKITDFGGVNLKKSENISPVTQARRAFNFSSHSGALTAGLGIKDIADNLFNSPEKNTKLKSELGAHKNIKRTYFAKKYNLDLGAREDKLMFVDVQGRLHCFPLSSAQFDETAKNITTVGNLKFSAPPQAINYRLNSTDVTIFTNAVDPMVVFGATQGVYKVIDAPHITSMALHYERLFATVDGEKSAVWFSDDLDPTNWSVSLTEAGFIQMLDERGALLKVLAFGDYVYVFRDFGISRITAYADQQSFSVGHLFVSSGRIYPNTVMACGDVVIFLASDGLYRFDGINCTKILTGLDKGFLGLDNTSACVGFFENKFYLACKFRFDEMDEIPLENNAVIEVDINSFSADILFGVCVFDINTVLSEEFSGVCVCVKLNDNQTKVGVFDHSGSVFGEATKKEWTSPLTDLGYPAKRKMIRRVCVTTLTPCEVVLANEDGYEKRLKFKGSPRPQELVTRLFGARFSFKFLTSSARPEIVSPHVVISLDGR